MFIVMTSVVISIPLASICTPTKAARWSNRTPIRTSDLHSLLKPQWRLLPLLVGVQVVNQNDYRQIGSAAGASSDLPSNHRPHHDDTITPSGRDHTPKVVGHKYYIIDRAIVSRYAC